MFKRAMVVFAGIGFAAVLGAAGVAHALGVGVGVGTNPVPTPVLVPPAAASVVGGAGNVVSGTVPGVVPASPVSTPVFEGPPETTGGAASSYKAFEDLVNDVADGGGSSAPVVAIDAFSAAGVDGGVAGVPALPHVALVR